MTHQNDRSGRRPTSFRLSLQAEERLDELKLSLGLNRSQVLDLVLTGFLTPARIDDPETLEAMRSRHRKRRSPKDRTPVRSGCGNKLITDLIRLGSLLGLTVRLGMASGLSPQEVDDIRACLAGIYDLVDRLAVGRGASK